MPADLPHLCGYVRGVCGQQGKCALLLTGIPATVHPPLKWGDRGNSRDTVSGTEMHNGSLLDEESKVNES